jgi:hypothetical protein
METLNNYLAVKGYSIVEGAAATVIFVDNKDKFEKICGSNIFDTLDDFMSDEDSDDIKLVIINNGTGEPTSVFLGSLENEILHSDYTCSNRQIYNGGVLLRFYALLLAHERDPKIVNLEGGISGGIPAIEKEDSKEVLEEKKNRLKAYHIKKGAQVDGDIFTYNLEEVERKIVEIFAAQGGKAKRKTRKLKNKKRRQTKRNQKHRKKSI